MARPGLRNHPKFRLLCHLLDETAPHVWGYLEMMWEVGYESGNPVLGDHLQVELACGWKGEPGKLAKALIDCKGAQYEHGFIEPVEGKSGAFQIHDLWSNAPDYVKKRRERELERQKKSNPLSAAPNGAERHTTAPNGRPPARAPAPARNLGEESPKNPSCSEPARPASEPNESPNGKDQYHAPCQADMNPGSGRLQDRGGHAQVPDQAGELDPAGDPVVLIFPTVGGKGGKGPTEWSLRQSKVAEYAQCFPGIDVMACCRRALQWCRDNEAKRKTLGGMPKFLFNWLSKEQDRGGGYRSGETSFQGLKAWQQSNDVTLERPNESEH
jgi:hypothetical protein